jgi:hypothetical protein
MAPGLLPSPVVHLLSISLVLGFGLALAACDDDNGSTPDAGIPDAAAVAGQGGPPTGALVINEVAPDPADGAADWIELLVRGDAPVDLCGWFLTDLVDRLDHYHPLGGVQPPEPCPPRLLGPGARLVVIADDGVGAGIDHAGFKLGHADEVHLVAIDGPTGDGLLYLLPAGHAGHALARAPDGEGLFVLAEPTPGAPNPEGASP